MNKRGQFYITAAIIIVLAISGLSGIATYAIIKPEPRTISDLGVDLKEESARMIDYGVSQKEDLDEDGDYDSEDLKLLIEEFVKDTFAPYFLQKTENANVFFIYGDKDNLYQAQYTLEDTGTISLGGQDWTPLGQYTKIRKITPNEISGDNVKLEILDTTFNFKVRDNEMFYFLMVKEEEQEIYVEKNV